MINQTTTYKSTFIQRLLGRNYKWWYIISFYFSRTFSYRISYFAMALRYFVPVVIILTVMFSNGNSNLTDYYLLASIFAYNPSLIMNISFEMKDGVLLGNYSRLLLLPINLFLYWIAQSIGMMILPLVLRIIIFLPLYFYFQVSFSFSIHLLIAILFSLLFSIVIGAFIEIIIGSSSFIYPDNKFLLFGYQDLSELLSGGIVPLLGFLNFLSILPFSFWVHHPMQIYLDKYSPLETFYVFAGGMAWCIILYFLAKLIFKLGLKKNEAVGL